jgi:hypothetical protein
VVRRTVPLRIADLPVAERCAAALARRLAADGVALDAIPAALAKAGHTAGGARYGARRVRRWLAAEA